MRCTLRTVGGVLVVAVTGVVTPARVGMIRAQMADRLRDERAVLIDYSRAAVALTEDDLAALYTGKAPARVIATPSAWAVPTEEVAEMWRRQVLRYALTGKRRFVTTDPVRALAWAMEQARLAQSSG